MKKTIALILSFLLLTAIFISMPVSVSAESLTSFTLGVENQLKISETVSDKSLESTLEEMIACPHILSVTQKYPGVKVTWTNINGAAKYRLYYKTEEDLEWTKAADSTETSAIHVPEESNRVYYYTVRAVDSQDVECVGYDSLSASILYIAAPAMQSATASKDGINVRWQGVNGASNYRVFYRIEKDGEWKKLVDTTQTSFVQKDFEKDCEYAYTVRCLDEDGKDYISTFDPKGIKSEFLNTPYVQLCEPVEGGVKITWKEVSGADNYRVFVKAGKAWRNLGDTTETSMIHNAVENNTKYTYTVRALSKDGKSFTSEFDRTGYEYQYFQPPVLSAINDTLKGPAISWEKVEGIKQYQIFYSVDGSKWKTDGSMKTETNTYTLTNAEYGHRYRFTVKCLNEDGQYVSYHDTKDLSAMYLEPPKLSAAYAGGNVNLNWNSIEGAEGYILFAKSSDSDTFKVVERTKETSTVYDPGTDNYTLQFALRCLDKDGEFASAYRKACIVTSYLVETGIPDPSYSTICIDLNEKDRDLAERICYGEAGSLGFTGMALVAQCIRDTYVKDGYNNIADILEDYGYDGSTATPGNDEAKEAVRFIFDNGGAAVQHRILVFYASDLIKSSFHESQNFVCMCGAVKFFDFW